MKEKKLRDIRQAPATNPEDRENQLIALAMRRAEEQLIEGTASSQVITHFLKLATTRERLEKEILERQKDLITAKTEALQNAKKIEELYENALRAMGDYRGAVYDENEDAD